MRCRDNCAACCTAPAIVQPFYRMPQGKAAGEPCVHLDEQLRCRIFGQPQRPAFCVQFMPEPEFCGDSREQALQILQLLDARSAPP